MSPRPHNSVRLVHRTRCRVRFKVPGLQRHGERAGHLQRVLARQRHVRSVSLRPLTGSVIVHLDTGAADPSDLLRRAQQALAEGSPAAFDPVPPSAAGGPRLRPQPGALRRGIFGTLVLAAVTAVLLWRRYVLRLPLPSAWLAGAALIGGAHLFYRALGDLRGRRLLSANTFLSVATLLALAAQEAIAALEVLWIQEIGQLLEDYVQDRSRRAIRNLFLIAPDKVFIVVDGVEVETAVTRVDAGDTLSVREFETIPVDGEVLEGRAQVDEAHISGRAEPALRTPGHTVYAGTTVQEGHLHVKAAQVGEATYLAKVVRMVEASLAERTALEKRVDRLSSRLALLGVAAAAGTYLLTRNAAKTLAVQLALASPCATVLAASTAVSAALANAARQGALIKGGPYLERLATIDCICFDKTGTLSDRLPKVAAVIPAGADITSEAVLAAAAAAQQRRQHPIARALWASAPPKDRPAAPADSSVTHLGRGVQTRFGNTVWTVGNAALMRQERVDVSGLAAATAKLTSRGWTVIYVARNAAVIGVIGLAYAYAPATPLVLDELRRDGIGEMHLVSGDSGAVVAKTAQQLHFSRYRGDMRPEEKAAYVARLVKRHRTVVMVGDGINDAPALAEAHIGIAMAAGGAEMAIEAADIALVDSRLEQIPYLRSLSRQTLRITAQNHWFAVTTDVLSAALALTGLFSPVMSGVAHVAHTLAIGANSSRLLSWRPHRSRL